MQVRTPGVTACRARAWLAPVGLLVALVAGTPALAADNGLRVLAVTPASGGSAQVQVEVDPALEASLQQAGAGPERFRVLVEQGGGRVTAVRRMRDEAQEAYTLLAFDQSGSFAAHWAQAFTLARTYADALNGQPRHTVAVMTFGVNRVRHCEETQTAGLVACLGRVAQAGARQKVTRLKFYIQEAVREVARKQPLLQLGSREVIVFTDAGDESQALDVHALAAEARERGVRVHVVCFTGNGRGKGLARRLDEMQQLAEGSGGRYLQVEDTPDPAAAMRELARATEQLYWLDVAFCDVKPGRTHDRLSVEVLTGGARTHWSSPVRFRQSAEGSATAPCQPAPASASSGTSASPGATPSPGSAGTVTPPGTPGASPGSTPSGPAASSGAPASPGASPSSGAPSASGASPGSGSSGGGSAPAASASPWRDLLPWLLLLLVLGAGILLVLLVLLARRRERPKEPPVVAAAPPPQPPAPAPTPEPAPPPAPAWKDPFLTLPETRLVVLRGPPGLEAFYRVHKSPFTLGARAAEMDLALEHPSISGHHATVQLYRNGNVFVTDERSTNGTFVDGRRLEAGERVPVKAGQVLRLGAHLELKVEQPSAQAVLESAAPPMAVAPPLAPAPAAPAESPRAKMKTVYAPARGEDE